MLLCSLDRVVECELDFLYFFCSATMANKYEELELLYTNLGKVIYEGLSNFAKYEITVFYFHRNFAQGLFTLTNLLQFPL
jgi:hypothetical protein